MLDIRSQALDVLINVKDGLVECLRRRLNLFAISNQSSDILLRVFEVHDQLLVVLFGGDVAVSDETNLPNISELQLDFFEHVFESVERLIVLDRDGLGGNGC